MSAQQAVHIVVVGAGYAGRAAAVRLGLRMPGAQISVVEPGALVFERARLHEYIAQTSQPSRPLGWLLPTSARHVQARAERVDLEARALWLEGQGAPLTYDWLVLALGSQTRGAPGALPLEDARLPALVAEQAEQGGAVTVLGGGLSGVEVACEIAERWPTIKVTLATRGALLAARSPAAREHTRGVLQARGVTIKEQIGPDEAHDGLVIAATGFAPRTLAGLEACATSADGRLLVDGWLRLDGAPRVVVVGDMAAVEDGAGGYLRQACAAALPMGTWAGDAIAAWEAGHEPLAFSMRFDAVCVGLGRRDGVIDHERWERHNVMWPIMGRSASWAKEAILKMTVWAPRVERRWALPVYTWPGRGAAHDARLIAQEG